MPMNETIYATAFDGEQIIENAEVTVEKGIVTAINQNQIGQGSGFFLMPGLIDAHTHMGTREQVDIMLRNGITATCDVSAPAELVAESEYLRIVPSAGMAMGVVMNPKRFVEKAVANGAKYIKVLLFNPMSIGKHALNGIVKEAHDRNLKVAVHATELETVRQAVEADADILLHVPMKEAFPPELAREIARKGIAVAPTLVMMETFSVSGRNGYQPEHYANAEAAVRLLREEGVTILGATDANPGNFAPEVVYGSSMHRELELLVKAGLSPVEALTASTSRTARVFGISGAGKIQVGSHADMVLVEGRPDRNITDSRQVLRVWSNGKTVWEKGNS